MTSKERVRTFLEAHLGQSVSMEMLAELSESFEHCREDEGKERAPVANEVPRALPKVREAPLRVVPEVDEEVDDDATE